MEKDDTLLPERWRNKLYKFMVGGYDGCICHPAALFVTGDGHVRLVGSDGGSGGLDAEDWYSRTMRAYYNGLGINSDGELLYGPKANRKAYDDLCEYRRKMTEERRRRERMNVRVALEAEVEHGNLTGMRWDHEFQEYDISTPDKVRETCKAMCHAFLDVFYHAGIADALREEGYEGAGVICSDCGEYFEDCDYESFADCVDRDAYKGIGGLAVAYTRILCTDCRQASECPYCYDLNLPTSKEQKEGHDTDHMDYATKFFYEFITACEYCSDGFVRMHDMAFDDPTNGLRKSEDPKKMERLKFAIKPVLDALEEAEEVDKFDPEFVASCRKYAEGKRTEEKWTDDQIKDVVVSQFFGDIEDKSKRVTKKFREELFKSILVPIVDDYFQDCYHSDIENLDAEWKELIG